MTSTVSVTAHCHPDMKVIVVKADMVKAKIVEYRVLADGESCEMNTYEDFGVSTKEVDEEELIEFLEYAQQDLDGVTPD
jgi:hypothetical protein